MKLERISVSGQDGLKGWTGEQVLAGVDVFAGPNGAGKSTRLLAVSAGLRGLASTPQDPVREYLGPELPRAVVDLDFDTGRVSRQLAAGARTADAKRADAIADQAVGAHVVRWDLADFAVSTTANRQALLDRVCDLAAAGWTVDALVGELTPSKAVDDLVESGGDVAPDAWLTTALAWAKRAYTEANRDARRLKASAERAVELASGYRGASVPELDRDLEGAREQAEELGRRLEGHKEARQRADAQRRRREELDRVRGDLAKLPPLEGSRESVEAAVEAAVEAVEGLTQAQTSAHEAYREAAWRVDAARARLDTRREAATGPCVHCGHADPLGSSAELAALRSKVEQEIELLEEAELDYRVAQAELFRARATMNAALTDRAAWLEREQFETRVRDLESGLEDEGTAADTEDLEGELARARATVRELEAQRTRAIQAAEGERQAQLEMAERDEALERLEDVKCLGKELKALQLRIIEDSFGPLEREASAVVEPVLGAQVRFISADVFGLRWRAGGLVPWWALSDGERAVVGAGISYAFARLGGSGWRAVILDGAEAVDEGRLKQLVAVLADRIRVGDLDNALLAVRADAPPNLPGAYVHFMGGK